jgi:hypothetical protein
MSGQTFTSITMTIDNVGANDALGFGPGAMRLSDGNTWNIGIGTAHVSVSAGVATFTVDGMSLSNSQLQDFVDSLSYNVAGSDVASGQRTVAITQVTDSGASNNTTNLSIVATVNVIAVNDQPYLSATGLSPTYTENGSAVDLFGNADIGTIETGQKIKSLTLTVSGLQDGGNEQLVVDGETISLVDGSGSTANAASVDYTISVSNGVATVTLSDASA